MLDHVASELLLAERLADRVVDLCRQGVAVDNELAGLNQVIGSVVDNLSSGVPPEHHTRWLNLTRQLAAATTAAEARKEAISTQLEQLVRQDRVRKAYIRPPS